MPVNAADLQELLDGNRRRWFEMIRNAQPALVKRFDASGPVCDVLPLLPDETKDATTGARLVVPCSLVANVPIAYQQGGGFYFTFELIPDQDQVLLVFTDRALDRWKSTGQLVDPIDPRRHHLTDAIAIPGLAFPGQRPTVQAPHTVLSVSRGELRLGGPTASDGVARASRVEAELNALWSALDAHSHASFGTGPLSATFIPPATPPGPLTGSAGAVGSSTVKVVP